MDGRRTAGAGSTSTPSRRCRWPIVALVVLAAVLIAAFVLARRHGDDVTPPGVVLIGVALARRAASPRRSRPIDPVFGVVPHKVRWLWALGAFIAAVVVGALLRAAERRSTVTATRASWVAVAGAVVVSVLTVPTYRAVAGPVDQPEAWPVAAELRDQLGPLEDAGTVLRRPRRARLRRAVLVAVDGRAGAP